VRSWKRSSARDREGASTSAAERATDASFPP
jgi:hypothetical protein